MQKLKTVTTLAPAMLTVLIAGLLLQMISSSMEAVRVRNSLIFRAVDEQDLHWKPPNYPTSFKLDGQIPPLEFSQAVNEIVGEKRFSPVGFQHALALGNHLAVDNFKGGRIQSDAVTNLESIVAKGAGYCADFAQVYNGLAHTLSLPVREWGMSFDGFGGDVHAFNEIYDSEHDRWVFMDSYFSFYVIDRSTEEPLSVLEFRERLRSEATRSSIVVVPISAERFLFKSSDNALDYYQRGVNQFFMVWGNNVFEYDNSLPIALGARISRSVEQAMAILAGVHPEIRIPRSSENEIALAELDRLKTKFLILAIGGFLTFSVFLAQLINLLKKRSPRSLTSLE